ncbi:GTP 3',8-cyclase MoaA [Archaeoglobus profundus]|uniref:Probable GTP 3',8-cyclase n=1 Tax=Archaeoglobus profundus (strain DSM 5631 / JCM 9629 / NBRC 100127 / Av18) TaxID=572546 RepID=D2RH35_ARCPA|nr:GTP 3',8-cyclase MoaA [Archaeoglobus profundus]ADB57610.1 molybdenum cofactor biosynthesis protein A [Archaeoglobus profundus DSM 5631]
MLVDRYGRPIKHLRISVTSLCNMNCIYCHNEGMKDAGKDMSLEEIIEICKVFYDFGVEKVKITGGEPLIRGDIMDIIAEMPEFKEISMVTNGYYLSKYAYELKEVGLNRVNVSLDTLNPETYRFITGVRGLEKVLDGIESAYNAELTPIKLNMVVMKGVNEHEIEDILEYTARFNKNRINVVLQLIELVGHDEYYYSLDEIEEKFKSRAKTVITRSLHARRQYILGNKAVEFVRPFHAKFCMHCTRMRVTSDGKLKPCLMRDVTVDVRGLKGEELLEAIKRAVELREPYVKDLNQSR